MTEAARQPFPPCTTETAARKARLAGDASNLNSRDPARVSLAHTPGNRWRNRTEFLRGRNEIRAFLARKRAAELDYRVIKNVRGCRENRMAARFAYEARDAGGDWFRSHGNGLWESDAQGLMVRRVASTSDMPVRADERLFDWPQGRRPDGHPGLSDLGL